jgi:hypothetical protein
MILATFVIFVGLIYNDVELLKNVLLVRSIENFLKSVELE